MEIIRIPKQYRKTISRCDNNSQAWILQSLFSLASGEDVILTDSNEGDLLELIWRDCINIEKKNGKKGLNDVGLLIDSNNGFAGDPPSDSATKESKGKESKVKETNTSSEELKNLIDFWNTRFIKKLDSKNKTISIGENIMQTCNGETPTLKISFNKKRKLYSVEQIKEAMTNYARDRVNRNSENDNSDFSMHKFSFYEFISQKNGLDKFINK